MAKVEDNWYIDFFASEMPGRLGKYDESALSRRQVDFIAKCTAITDDSRVLDVCCGKGRHLLEFLRRGIHVAGIDSSPYMLAQCRTIADLEGLHPHLQCADVRHLAIDSEYDVVYMVLPALGFFCSDEEDDIVIRNVSAAIRPGGLVFMDLVPLEGSIRGYVPEKVLHNSRGELVVKRKEYDPLTGRLYGSDETHMLDGTIDKREHRLRLYSCTEMRNMLMQNGILTKCIYGDYEGASYTIDSRHMIIVGQKSPKDGFHWISGGET
jgi:D-alanine-D-alanine ligase